MLTIVFVAACFTWTASESAGFLRRTWSAKSLPREKQV